MSEVWRDIPGYEGLYQVSDQGRVRSLDRSWTQVSRSGKPHLHRMKGRILRPGRVRSGHVSVLLGRDGGSRLVHALVALTFIGARPLGGEVRHLNGNPADNRLENLTWGTRSQNGQDKKWHGGQKTYLLSPEAAATIKRRLREGEMGSRLSREFGVAASTISAIKHGRFHRDVIV